MTPTDGMVAACGAAVELLTAHAGEAGRDPAALSAAAREAIAEHGAGRLVFALVAVASATLCNAEQRADKVLADPSVLARLAALAAVGSPASGHRLGLSERALLAEVGLCRAMLASR